MDVQTVLALPEDIEVMGLADDDESLTISARSTQITVCCPICGTLATRVHSRYTRCLAEVPCGGRRVCLQLLVRKYFCEVPTCERKIFTERFTAFVQSWARVTRRLYQVVQMLGLATGGRLGVRVMQRLGIRTSRRTILRRIMALPAAPVAPVTHVGIDDFSFRRGRRFGSIIVNLQTRQVIDLLPDRTAETAAAWMSVHPEITFVSRDRGGDYAAAARQGAPQATQVADRFHIYKNLVDAVELTLARCRTDIRQAASASNADVASLVEPLRVPTEVVSIENWKQALDAGFERERHLRRAQRLDRYRQMVDLQTQGLPPSDIARRVGLGPRTVARWLAADTFPERKPRPKQKSRFDPYAAYILQRWEQGCRNGLQMYQEIKAQGFTGSERMVYRFLLPLRRNQRIILLASVPHAPLQDFSAHAAVWLFVRDPTCLDEEELTTLATICQASTTAQQLYELVQDFRQMLHHREGAHLDEWLARVAASTIRELQSFAFGVERDKAAVQAGLIHPHSNGIVEGKVHKLKLIKRMMFGRAKFPLLRQRVLHAL